MCLESLGEHDAFVRLTDNVSAEDAVKTAQEVRAAADRIRQKHPYRKGKREKVFHAVDAETGEIIGQRTLTEVLDEIRGVADWYEKVGSMHFGVKGLQFTP
jgi:hypothetical protein